MQNAELVMQKNSAVRAERDIEKRTFKFGVRIIRLVNALPRKTAGFVLGRQIARSGTGVGANVEEAQAAHTHEEFTYKMNLARKEARESHYWLRMIAEVRLVPADLVAALIQEADEIVRILTSIVKKSRSNK